MEYRETQPAIGLRRFVRCVWTLVGSGAGPAATDERVVPDGCSEIVLNRAERFRRKESGDSHLQSEILLVGQIRGAIAIAPTGTIDLVGIRFEPGGLHALLGVPMHELTDLDVNLADVDADLHRRLAAAARLEREHERLAAAEAALLDRLRERRLLGSSYASFIPSALAHMERPLANSESVASALNASRRTVERAFRTEVGLSPRLYHRIRRLQGVLRRIDERSLAPSWAQIAGEHGYADQSHLIRDFRLIAGTTPGRYLAERTPLAAFFDLAELSRSSNPPARVET